jgi:hypothetical protein
MTVKEFKEKYKVDNFGSYIKEGATVEYWQELIVNYEIDKLNFQSYPEALLVGFDTELNGTISPFHWFNFSQFCKQQIKILEIKNQYNAKEVEAPTEPKYKTRNLFKVGLLFATGQMNKYFELGKDNRIIANTKAPAIARDLNSSVSDKYILASISEYKGNKNIFNSYEMMTNVIEHCKAENIPIEPFFMQKYSSIEHF